MDNVRFNSVCPVAPVSSPTEKPAMRFVVKVGVEEEVRVQVMGY